MVWGRVGRSGGGEEGGWVSRTVLASALRATRPHISPAHRYPCCSKSWRPYHASHRSSTRRRICHHHCMAIACVLVCCQTFINENCQQTNVDDMAQSRLQVHVSPVDISSMPMTLAILPFSSISISTA